MKWKIYSSFNPHTPVVQKVANEVFRRFQGKGVEFVFLNRIDLPQIFDAHLLEKTI